MPGVGSAWRQRTAAAAPPQSRLAPVRDLAPWRPWICAAAAIAAMMRSLYCQGRGGSGTPRSSTPLVIRVSPLAVSSKRPPLDGIARVSPQHPLQLLARQPATEPSRVLLGTVEERLAQALVQAFATLMIGVSRTRLQLVHAVQTSDPWDASRLGSPVVPLSSDGMRPGRSGVVHSDLDAVTHCTTLSRASNQEEAPTTGQVRRW